MDLKGIKEYLGDDWKRVEAKISELLRSDIDILNSTNARIIAHSGKQLRPLLSILIARACSGGNVTEASISYAAAAELLHNATLLHDDVADNSDQRRGVPTIKSLMGPSVSVLVGDFWLVKAMEGILSSGTALDNRVIRIFSKTLSDLAEGEMLQLQKAGTCDTGESDYNRIIFNKTASLFEAAAVSAAISVNAPEEVEKAVRTYAVSLGMAFQIRDDIFDYSPSFSQVGKPVGVDILEQKITLPLLGAMMNVSPAEADAVRGKVREIHSIHSYRDEIIEFVRKNGGIEYATRKLGEYIRDAVDSLSVIEDCKDKDYLAEVAYYVGNRLS